MKRDEIIKLAREAGFREPNPHDGFMGLAYDYRDGTDTGASLDHFAALVAAAEREECAKVCVASDLIDWPTSVEIAAIRKCAAAIRARSKA